jgi:hypothetical protein
VPAEKFLDARACDAAGRRKSQLNPGELPTRDPDFLADCVEGEISISPATK